MRIGKDRPGQFSLLQVALVDHLYGQGYSPIFAQRRRHLDEVVHPSITSSNFQSVLSGDRKLANDRLGLSPFR